MDSPSAVLIVDDDPMHLKIYSWIIEASGYRALPALVSLDQIDLPGEAADLIVLDYHLSGQMTAVKAANLLKEKFPGAPIIILSDAHDLPDDVAPLVDGFVRKGDPAKLVNALAGFLHPTS